MAKSSDRKRTSRSTRRQQVEQLLLTNFSKLYGIPADRIQEVPNPIQRYGQWIDAKTLGEKLVPGWLRRYVECSNAGTVSDSNRSLQRLAELVGGPLDNYRFETRLAAQLMAHGVPEAGLPGLTLVDAVRLLEEKTIGGPDATSAAWSKWRVSPGEAFYDGQLLQGLSRRHRRILAALVQAKGRTVMLKTLTNHVSKDAEDKTNAVRQYISAIRKAARDALPDRGADPIEDMDGEGYRLASAETKSKRNPGAE